MDAGGTVLPTRSVALVRNGNVIEVAQLPYRAGIARRY